MTEVILPRLNQTGANEWSDVESNDVALREVVNGQLDNDNIKVGANISLSKLASDARPFTWYTPKVIATEEGRTSTSYGTLTTPDEITGVELPANGLIILGYRAAWKRSSGETFAAIFLGSNQMKVGSSAGSVETQEAGGAFTNFTALTSGPIGLLGGGETTYEGDVTTGQALATTTDSTSSNRVYQYSSAHSSGFMPEHTNYGGLCFIFAAAGTYTISIKYKANSGTVTAKNRKLWVATVG